jgi:hypothetical protein
MIWLELLYDTGTDLMHYGRKEKELQQEGRTTSFWLFPVWQRKLIGQPGYIWAYYQMGFSISFEFGPKPSDWHFWIIEEMDNRSPSPKHAPHQNTLKTRPTPPPKCAINSSNQVVSTRQWPQFKEGSLLIILM